MKYRLAFLISIMFQVAAIAQTVAPVQTPSAVIDTGTIAGQAVAWMIATFGTTIGAALTALIIRYLKNAGIVGADLLRDKLQRIIVNGLNAGGKMAEDQMVGHGKIEVQNAIVAHAVDYVQAHGADTMKALGMDPTSPEAIESIKARIATAVADPNVPTPPVMDGKQQVPQG